MLRRSASKVSQDKTSSIVRQLKPQRTATSQRTGQSSNSSGHHKISEKPARPRVCLIFLFLTTVLFQNIKFFVILFR